MAHLPVSAKSVGLYPAPRSTVTRQRHLVAVAAPQARISCRPERRLVQGEKFAVTPLVPGSSWHGLLVVPSQGPPVQPTNLLPGQGIAVMFAVAPKAPRTGMVGGSVVAQPLTAMPTSGGA
jgi:hypothetical protein